MYCYPGGRKVLGHGITIGGSACTKWNVVVVTADKPYHSLVVTVAHELAHALGAPHDGNGKAKKCPASERHIMAPSLGAETKATYSKCTKSAINKFLKTKNASCLSNRRCVSSTMKEGEQENMKLRQCGQYVPENQELLNATVTAPCTLSCNVMLPTGTEGSFDRRAPDFMDCKEKEDCQVCNDGFCV
ncbi:hypothetical protein MRX96_052418 [Rhipicephalus microplus]